MGHGSSVQTTSKYEQKGSLPKFGEFKELYSIIRLINFNHFKTLKAMPRYPDNADVTITLDQLSEEEYNKSLIVFVSHCWLRGWSGAKGWDGRPHPDDAEGSKYDLCVRGIECIMKGLAPGMEECFIWLDFGCIDQDGNPAGELKLLDKIIQVSDCIVTPIVDENHSKWDYKDNLDNYFHRYRSQNWIGKDFSYLNRGWCRVEMFFAANIPLLEDSEERRSKMKAALKLQRSQGRRPHILYGTKEQVNGLIPYVLPPLQNSYFSEFHPEKGHLSKEEDRAVIKRLVKDLDRYMIVDKVEKYLGKLPLFSTAVKNGKGVKEYENGDRYEGQFKNYLRHGKGKYTTANGNVYEGEFSNDVQNGAGLWRNYSGDVYQGQYRDGMRNGHGTYKFISGAVYKGTYKDGEIHGQGTYTYPTGDRCAEYKGDFVDGWREGKGKLKYSNGDFYEGEFKKNSPEGSGTLKKANGDVYRGVFLKEQITGRGVYSYANGDVYEGEMKEGKKHGRGKLTKAIDGEVVEGEWRDDAVV